MKYDDIVVGAGVSGLSAALLLAQQGRNVALIEKAPCIAPTIRGFVRDGIYFDTGFHYAAMLGKNQPLGRLFDRLGILPHLRIRENGDQEGDYFLHPSSGFRFQFGRTIQDFTAHLTELFPDETGAIEEYLLSIQRFLKSIRHELFAAVANPAHIFENADFSLGQYLRERFRSPVLQTLFSIHSILYGSFPQETAWQYHSMVAGGYYDTSQQIYDGGYALAQAFHAELQKYKVPVYANRAVRQICLNNRREVQSVRMEEDDVMECDNCLYTAHPRLLPSLLPEKTFRPVYQDRLKSLEGTLSAVVLYCKPAEGSWKPPFQNLILVPSFFPELYEKSNYESVKCPMFISHSLSENQGSGISIICPWNYKDVQKWSLSKTGDREPDYYSWKERTAGMILEEVQKNSMDILGKLEMVDVASPLTFRDYMNTPQGSLYGIKHRIFDMPLLPRTKVKGLYLSGQAILAAGVMGAMLAGFLTAAAITGEDYGETMDL